MIVGLTGGIGSGKTTVAKIFATHKSVATYIADIQAKKLMNSSSIIKKKIIEDFGENAYQNNQLNREFIAKIVFKNKQKLAVLNKIVHPEVTNHFQKFVLKNKDKIYILYESAILFENKSDLFCDFIISVSAPLHIRIQRVINRDHSSKKAVLERVKNQWLEDKKLLQSNYVIINDSLTETKNQIFKIHTILTEKRTAI